MQLLHLAADSWMEAVAEAGGETERRQETKSRERGADGERRERGRERQREGKLGRGREGEAEKGQLIAVILLIYSLIKKTRIRKSIL